MEIKKKDIQQADKKNIYHIENRFGKILINYDCNIFFPYGLAGIGDFKHFCICVSPLKKVKGFKLLQSIDNQHLCFLIMPALNDGTYLDKVEVLKVSELFNIDKNQIALAFIAADKMIDGKKRIVLNLKAPIIFDLERNMCYQYIFKNAVNNNVKIIL